MKTQKNLLILGPSFRRRNEESLPAIERYDGIFFRIARKYLLTNNDIDVLIMKEDLLLVKSKFLTSYVLPVGKIWGKISFSSDDVDKAKLKNSKFVGKLQTEKYKEIFIVVGKNYFTALPDQLVFRTKITIAGGSNLGSKAKSLVDWFKSFQ